MIPDLDRAGVAAIARPRLRGTSHMYAAFACVPLAILTVAMTAGTRARIAAAVYVLSLIALFGISGMYHRVTWRSPGTRAWMRRLDHSTIFVMIAGSYTPFAMIALTGAWSTAILSVVWGGALLGIVITLLWPTAPKWVDAAAYVTLGWVAVVAAPKLVSTIGVAALCLTALGGVLYTVGAVVYARGRPDPAPTVFGYHEVFHALVIAGAAVQYGVIAGWVLPG